MKLSNTVIGVSFQCGFSPTRTTNPVQGTLASETLRMGWLSGQDFSLGYPYPKAF